MPESEPHQYNHNYAKNGGLYDRLKQVLWTSPKDNLKENDLQKCITDLKKEKNKLLKTVEILRTSLNICSDDMINFKDQGFYNSNRENNITTQNCNVTKKEETDSIYVQEDIQSPSALEKQLKTANAELKNSKIEMQRLKKSNEDLKLKSRSLEREIEELKRQLETVNSELENHRAHYQPETKGEHRKLTKEIHSTVQYPDRLSYELHKKDAELKVVKTKLGEKDKKIDELCTRLSAEMSVKVSADERSLENINVKNRPLNVASEFQLLCSNEWHEAKETLDEAGSELVEEEKIKILRSVFELSASEATQKLDEVMQKFCQLIEKPLDTTASTTTYPHKVSKVLPANVGVLLGDLLRDSADNIDTSSISQISLEKLKHNHTTASFSIDTTNFKKFTEVCAKMTWKMTLQRPPMTFDLSSGLGQGWQGENKQEVFWSSSDPKDSRSKVKYYVHPALYHDKALMVKGRVFLSKDLN